MKLADITLIANSLFEILRPACARLEIAGSIRRRKAEPNDIELVCIPALGEYTIRDMFDQHVETQPIDYLAEALTCLLVDGRWELDPVTRRNGANYKRLRHVETLTACDLFITDPRRWAYTLTIRTGPGDFSKAFVTRALNMGMFFKDCLLHNHAPEFVYKDDGSREVKPCLAGERCLRIVETPDEIALFRALHLDYLEPEQRGAIDPRRVANLPASRGWGYART